MDGQKFSFHTDYVDLLDDDILAALMLSRIVDWYVPSKETERSELWVYKEGKWWVVRSQLEWLGECGFNRSQSTHCLGLLVSKGIIEKRIFKFDGTPTMHVRLCIAGGTKTLLTEALTAEQLVDDSVAIQQ